MSVVEQGIFISEEIVTVGPVIQAGNARALPRPQGPGPWYYMDVRLIESTASTVQELRQNSFGS